MAVRDLCICSFRGADDPCFYPCYSCITAGKDQGWKYYLLWLCCMGRYLVLPAMHPSSKYLPRKASERPFLHLFGKSYILPGFCHHSQGISKSGKAIGQSGDGQDPHLWI